MRINRNVGSNVVEARGAWLGVRGRGRIESVNVGDAFRVGGRPLRGSPSRSSMDTIKSAARLLLLALPPYFAWEMLQAPAFTGMPPGRWSATAVCALAAVGDGVIVLVVFSFAALLFHDWRWFVPPRVGRYLTALLLGVVLQVAIEWIMVYRLGRWGYASWQSVVPILGVGILPILQPIVLLPLVFWALARTGSPARAKGDSQE